MSRNVTIVVIILIIVLLASYLVWLRARYNTASVQTPSPAITETASPSATLTPSPTATASAAGKQATKSGSLKSASPSAKLR
jgi:cytoskeletal protein RodZ